VVAYLFQLVFGIVLLVNPHHQEIENLSYIMFATLIVSLQRAWALLKGKHLAPHADEPPAAPAGEPGIS
jgi:hypothetical protein